MPSLTIQGIHLLVPLRIHPHRPSKPSNYRSPDWRKHGEFQPILDLLLHAFSSSSLITVKHPALPRGASLIRMRNSP